MLKCGNAPCRLWDSGAEHYCTCWRGQLSSDCGFFEYVCPNEGPMPDREFTEIVTIGGECLSETNEPEEVPGGSCPSQYHFPEGLCEIQDLVEHRDMNFAIGNIFKACYRMGHCSHSDSQRDLNKIIFFAKRELARYEKEETTCAKI